MNESQSDSNDEFEDEFEEEIVVVNVKGKGKAKVAKGKGEKGEKKEVKRRSSKACDNCRKSKCKCTRDEEGSKCHNCITAEVECTYLGQSRKRGPPKGYIEAIESRLNRMESLMGTLLSSDDPRAQVLLGELIGNEEAREVLTKDLRSAVANTSNQRKLWSDIDPSTPSSSHQVSHGFDIQQQQQHQQSNSSNSPLTRTWFTEEELLGGRGVGGGGGGSNSVASPHGVFSNTQGYDSATAFTRITDTGGEVYTTPSLFGVDIPVSNDTRVSMNPQDTTIRSKSISLSVSGDINSASPRLQRRRLNSATLPSIPDFQQLTSAAHPTSGGFTGTTSNVSAPLALSSSIGGQAFQSQSKSATLPPPNAIAHTGQSSYVLSPEAELSHANEMSESSDKIGNSGEREGGEMTELADVVGQLSLNENAEVRYHGRSSGLYLISRSKRYKDFFWQFPSAGVWPPTNTIAAKTEAEILEVVNLEDALPDARTQQHLLDLYWCYVHPHFPILYKVSFMRQYRHNQSNPNSTEPSTPSGSGKVPVVLLLSMFALAARYSDVMKPTEEDGDYWSSGTGYFQQAKKVLDYDYGSSKLVTVQALLLMAYREIGIGAMSSSWIFTGMAIRSSQDLGLFRDVDKWFLPVHKFSHEEKQSRKRSWWGCVILDRYTASYIGRPGTIHERDYDTSFPSEDEPDEHEQWRPIRPDGSDWSVPPKVILEGKTLPSRYAPTKAHTMSCFSAAGALAVLINRIIANIYAIRTRVLGQSSETLLTILDQSLASWYIALPPQLVYTPNSTRKVPPPHILSLHLQFYSALILLHRPFIPGQNSVGSPTTFPSHSICTTSANAISNIVATFSKTFTLRQCPPFLTYPIFSAGIMFVYNSGFDQGLALQAKVHLKICMDALEEMETIWGSATRQRELLHGLVDLREDDFSASPDGSEGRKAKRPAEAETIPNNINVDFRPANFRNSRPVGRTSSPSTSTGSVKPRRRSTSSSLRNDTTNFASPSNLVPSVIPTNQNQNLINSLPNMDGMFNFSLPSTSIDPNLTHHQSFDILNSAGADIDITQFRSPPGTSGGINYTDLLNSFLVPGSSNLNDNGTLNNMEADGVFDSSSAFFGMPLAGDLTEDWRSFLIGGGSNPTDGNLEDPSLSPNFS